MAVSIESVITRLYAESIPVRDKARLDAIQSPYLGAMAEGWSLSESGIRAAIWACEQFAAPPSIIEFGSGISTRILSAYFQGQADLLSFEHDAEFARSLAEEIRAFPGSRVMHCPMIQYSDEEFDRFFGDACDLSRLTAAGVPVDPSRNNDYTIHNAFYDFRGKDFPFGAECNLFIVDGPHGNGRSLAFPLIARAAAKRCFVLVDDLNHYEFLWRAGQCFRYNLVFAEVHAKKRWGLIELLGRP